VYSLTLQPELETPDMLKAYAERYAVGPGWQS
jgi:protein SCO1/2